MGSLGRRQVERADPNDVNEAFFKWQGAGYSRGDKMRTDPALLAAGRKAMSRQATPLCMDYLIGVDP